MDAAVKQQDGCEVYQNFNSITSTCRRQRVERRVDHRKAAIHAIYRHRRKAIRRDNDTNHGVYVDTHEPHIWYLSTGLMVFCVLDAFFTTILLDNGSEELNPLLDYLLQIDMSLFLGIKFLVTGLCISFLVWHKHHRLLNTISCYHLLIGSFVIYAILICYQLSMIRLLPILH